MPRKLQAQKVCILCKETKPYTTEYFYYRNKERGWLSSWCIPCRKKKRKETKDRELECQQKRRRNLPYAEYIIELAKNRKNAPKLLGPRYCRICNKVEMGKRKQICGPCMLEKKRAQKRYDKAIYKSRLKNAMPLWADKDKIREIYKKARALGMHVDHIIPIRGKTVSGLHCEANLQLLSPMDNIRKSNHYEW